MIGIEITTQCNFHCPHCFTSSTSRKKKELSTEQAKRLISDAASLGIKNLALSGGEPLLREDLIEIVSFAKECGLSTLLVTNGSITDEDLWKELGQNDLSSVQVSIDGPDPETNQMIRKNSPEDFYSALKTIRIVRGMGIYVSMGVFLHRDTIDMTDKFILLAEAMGVDCLRYASFIPTGRGKSTKIKSSVVPTREQLLKFAALVESHNSKSSIPITLDCPGGPVFFPQGYSCQAGQYALYLEANGDAYPCTTLCHEPFKLGNFPEKPLSQLVQSALKTSLPELSRFSKKGRCRICDNDGCMGGCPGVLYAWFKRCDVSLPSCAAFRKRVDPA